MKSEAFPPAQCSESSGHCLLCSAQQCWLLTSRREATVGSLHLSQKQRSSLRGDSDFIVQLKMLEGDSVICSAGLN